MSTYPYPYVQQQPSSGSGWKIGLGIILLLGLTFGGLCGGYWLKYGDWQFWNVWMGKSGGGGSGDDSKNKAKSEVYYADKGAYPKMYSLDYNAAQALAKTLGGTLATPAQLQEAQKSGAQWCSSGWLSDKSQQYPMQAAVQGCGNRAGIIADSLAKSGATIYGPKPTKDKYKDCYDSKNPPDQPCITNFSPTKFSLFN